VVSQYPNPRSARKIEIRLNAFVTNASSILLLSNFAIAGCKFLCGEAPACNMPNIPSRNLSMSPHIRLDHLAPVMQQGNEAVQNVESHRRQREEINCRNSPPSASGLGGERGSSGSSPTPGSPGGQPGRVGRLGDSPCIRLCLLMCGSVSDLPKRCSIFLGAMPLMLVDRTESW